MKPSRKEIESAIGGEIPKGVELEFGNSTPESTDIDKFDLVAIIKNKFSIWKKTVFGQLVGFYIALHGLGIPIPSLYEITSITMQEFVGVSHVIYDRAIDPEPNPFDRYLVVLPQELQMPPSGQPLQLDDLPTGSGVYALSSYDYPTQGRGLV